MSVTLIQMQTKRDSRFHVIALHRYYIWTTLMKGQFEAALVSAEVVPKDDPRWKESTLRRIAGPAGTYMSYWYGGLYVVCEGWAELKLSDQKIDALMQHPNLALLKRYRNGAFHFQKDYFDARFYEFQSDKSSVTWVRSLSDELSRWFLEYIRDNKTQTEPCAPSSSQMNPSPEAPE